ncbi:MAG: hypothetical protein A3H96_09760 [Acidobacteria bacterium RIFCSPLOWO2_02_FULL_67_36]|nr:MAG: hypothetical protein A3H96_09760 [Acidobacteria bacterium RIFCSPLOWO2_02_FULL_67_36]OFW24945.1 MAG: hypothetical protein A3G21_15980 [Acidobacteria bacterium RIFCSPLOWO2_12_FULL_66_21]
MGTPRVPERAEASRRRTGAPALPPAAGSPPAARALLLGSWPGRLFLVAAAVKLLIAAIRLVGELPRAIQMVSSAATIVLVLSVGYFVYRLFVLAKRRLLWRVRRKLILSYIFIGVVPALLIAAFFLVGAFTVSLTVSAYLFKDGYDKVVDDVKQVAQSAATDIGREPMKAQDNLDRAQLTGQQQYRGLSIVFIPAPKSEAHAARTGRWEHVTPPGTAPGWIPAEGFWGAIPLPMPDRPGEVELVVRAAIPARVGRGGRMGLVIADVPLAREVLDGLHERTGVKVGTVSVSNEPDSILAASQRASSSNFTLFGNSLAFLDCQDWANGKVSRASVGLTYRLGEVYDRLSKAQSVQVTGKRTLGEVFLGALIFVAVLFLIIEIAALVMGLTLARSITSAIHELFTGTERVRLGDFTHRISVHTRDQLGELASSFNEMTGSIEGLLQTAADKKRMEEELRIARQIQMSLLPRGPLDAPGLGITALCVPAREVGGDYYDFFPLPGERLGVLIADVAGKGTSAALYMAELKGVVLALSQRYDSPRELLIEVNHIISENLDSRSFITVTYAVIDRNRGTMAYCRAGHTPIIHLTEPGSGAARARVLTPSGMVLGLRIDGAEEKFAALLEEDRIDLRVGDVIVLYTDGITEAMNEDSDLFGEARLSRIVEEHGHLDSGELRERILREIEAFVGTADQHDDMTMILLKVEHVAAMAEAVAV